MFVIAAGSLPDDILFSNASGQKAQARRYGFLLVLLLLGKGPQVIKKVGAFLAGIGVN